MKKGNAKIKKIKSRLMPANHQVEIGQKMLATAKHVKTTKMLFLLEFCTVETPF